MTSTPRFASTAAAVAAFEDQGSLDPGTEGFWKVWGATPHTVLPGDLILIKDLGEVTEELIAEVFEAKAYPARAGFINAEGETFTYGALAPLVVLRWGTRHILA